MMEPRAKSVEQDKWRRSNWNSIRLLFLKVFITSSYDATTHFESTCLDILDVYRRVMGEPFDFTKITRGLDADENQEGAQ